VNSHDNYRTIIGNLRELKLDLHCKDFLLTWEKSKDEIEAVIQVAQIFKNLHKSGKSFRAFDAGIGISIFRDNSTRTKFSFASAVNALGLGLVDLDENKSQLAHGETERETAIMLSFLAETIGIRDDMYLGEGDRYQRLFSQSIQEGFEEKVLHHRPSIINLQSDIDHPTQTLSDLIKITDYFGGIHNLRGKKLAMTWAYSPSYGKPLSVPQGIIGLMTRFGMDVVLAHPDGYDLLPETINIAHNNANNSGGKFTVVNDMQEAFYNADIVYPKSWAPFKVMEQRTNLLKAKDKVGLNNLEQECLANNAKFNNWECNNNNMLNTKNSSALYMHCLPADITGVSCERGEVSKDIFEKYRSDTYHEASFKPFVIAAMIYLSRINNPFDFLEKIIMENTKRTLF